VHFDVAAGTERDEVFLAVISKLASPLNVMYLKISLTPADLTAPAVSLKHLLTETAI